MTGATSVVRTSGGKGPAVDDEEDEDDATTDEDDDEAPGFRIHHH